MNFGIEIAGTLETIIFFTEREGGEEIRSQKLAGDKLFKI